MDINKYRLLAVDDDKDFLSSLSLALSTNYDVTTVNNASLAMGELKKQDFDGILLDMDMPEVGGLQLLKILQGLKPHIPVLMLTGNKTDSVIVDSIKAGASDYVIKQPNEMGAELDFRISRMISQQNLATKNRILTKKIEDENSRRYEIVGFSLQTLKLRSFIQQMKGHSTPILILGESGTGKELVARGLNSQEVNGVERPFVAVNCAAIPENLLESELFGHEKGAFTGANERKLGKFQLAHKGDIFLDEIGDLPLSAQAKLLRVLQEKEITRVGSNEPIQVNVRVIAATHKDLKQAVIDGKFREDLYYRLAVMTLTSPPLRERSEDILTLVSHFLTDLKSPLKLSKDALSILEHHNWPGNIRALKNCIERAMILAQFDNATKIEEKHILLDNIIRRSEGVDGILVPEDLLPQNLDEVTKEKSKAYKDWADGIFLLKALRAAGKNKSELAKRLSVSRDFVHRRLKELSIGSESEL